MTPAMLPPLTQPNSAPLRSASQESSSGEQLQNSGSVAPPPVPTSVSGMPPQIGVPETPRP
jgi:hypothetical protein